MDHIFGLDSAFLLGVTEFAWGRNLFVKEIGLEDPLFKLDVLREALSQLGDKEAERVKVPSAFGLLERAVSAGDHEAIADATVRARALIDRFYAAVEQYRMAPSK